jgi:hypothetical protein
MLRPLDIEFKQTTEQSVEIGFICLCGHDETPRLLVHRGRSPSCRFHQAGQGFWFDGCWARARTLRRPAIKDEWDTRKSSVRRREWLVHLHPSPSNLPVLLRLLPENVFAFSMSCASLQTLQMLALVLAPLGLPNPGSQLYHFVGGDMEEPTFGSCHPECLFPALTALGDHSGVIATGERPRNTGRS